MFRKNIPEILCFSKNIVLTSNSGINVPEITLRNEIPCFWYNLIFLLKRIFQCYLHINVKNVDFKMR